MATGIEAVVNFFDAAEWNYELDEEDQKLWSGMNGKNGNWKFFVAASDENEMCLAIAILPQKCPEERRQACAELLTRINCGLVMGCFEMDMEDGQVHFRTACPYPNGQLEDYIIKNVVGCNIWVMDRYFAAIMEVIYGGASPKAVMAKLEAAGGEKRSEPREHNRFMSN